MIWPWLVGAAVAAVALRKAQQGAQAGPVELLEVTGTPGVPPVHLRANLKPDQRVTLLYAVRGTATIKHVGAAVVAVRAAPGLEYTGLLLDPVWEGLPAGSFVEFGARHVAAIA